MIKGIQITQSANAALLNSFCCWTKRSNRLVASAPKATPSPPIRKSASLTWASSNTVNCRYKPAVEGGQHLNVNVLRRETLKMPSPTRKSTRS